MAAMMMLDMIFREKIRMRSTKKKIEAKKTFAGMKVKEEPSMQRTKLEDCRVCLKNGTIPIFNSDSSENIAEQIKLFADIEVIETDFLPKLLCQECYNLLQAAILFRKHARETDWLLRKPVEPSTEVTVSISYDNDDGGSDWNMECESKETEGTKTNYDCKKCFLNFTDISEYTAHVRSKEHKMARQQCESCGALVSSRYMVAHVARFHSPVMPFVCDTCGKGFPIRASLQRHLQTHNEDLPFKCAQCPYRGRFREYLRLHMRSHTGEKPYSCEHCPSQFVNASNLKKHLRTHKEREHKCEQCHRGFYTIKHLEMHIRVDHNGIKEHQCTICGKVFAYRKQMMKHSSKVHHRPKLPNGRIPLYIQFDKKNLQKNVNENATQNVSMHNGNTLPESNNK